MMILIEGAPRSGKTWFQTNKVVYPEWKSGQNVWSNYRLHFSEDNERLREFEVLDQVFHLTNTVLAFDEAQDLFGFWMSMPIQFRNLLSHQGHRGLIAVANAQSYADIHPEARRMVQTRYVVTRIFRFPWAERYPAWLMIIHVLRKERIGVYADGEPKFQKIGTRKFYAFSKWFGAHRYDTHSNIENNRFICKLSYQKKNPDKKGVWRFKMIDREIQMNRNRKR